MGLEEILRSLEAEADRDGRQLIEDARAQAEKLLRRAEDEARAQQRAALEEVDRRCAEERRDRLGRARARLRLERESLRSGAVEHVFSEARAGLAVLVEGAAYRHSLPVLLEEALAAAEAPTAVRAHPRDAETLAAARPDVTVEPDPDVAAGVIVRDGAATIDNSLAARLQRAKELLQGEVAGLLFEGETDD